MDSTSLDSILGARLTGTNRCRFRVWAPRAQSVEVHLLSPKDRIVPLVPEERGYYSADVEDVMAGARYVYRLHGHGSDEKERPDPASRFQPEGVHGSSQVIDQNSFEWADCAWSPVRLEDYIIYELHVGTFAPEGTFESVTPRLNELRDLGVTALELMPVAQFPGSRNWGYDGVYPFAVQNSYGGPDALKRLVDACHLIGISVILDVVYNHLGPEGNYFGDFGSYFASSYKTPWGAALNFDGPRSDEVVRFFIQNALTWLGEFHIDALRLDAIHGIVDVNARPFLAMLAEAVREFSQRLGRKKYLIAESDLNDVKVLRPLEQGGFGMDAQWSDDFHHSLHALLTDERNGYYRDFGCTEHLAKAFREGFVYSGEYSIYRARRHGNSSAVFPARQFVVCAQNHDQVGNRMLGERLAQLVSLEKLKLAASVVILSSFLPLIFMGEEYGETSPFQYFTSHADPVLVDAVRRGRREDFAAFRYLGEAPDPQDEETFRRCRLNRDLIREPQHRIMLDFHQTVIALRKKVAALANLEKENMRVTAIERALLVERWSDADEAMMVFNFGNAPAAVVVPFGSSTWRKRLDSAEERWLGPGSAVPEMLDPSVEEAKIVAGASSCVVFTRGQ